MGFGIVLIGIGVVFGVIGALTFTKARKIAAFELRHAIVTHVLTLKKNKRKFYVPMVQLKVDDQVHAGQAKDVNGTRSYHENQKINVHWDPNHPEDMYIDGDNTLMSSGKTYLIIAAAAVVAGVIALIAA